MGCRIVACMTPLKLLECCSSIVNIWPSLFLFHLFYLFYSEVFNRLILLIGGRAHFVSKCKKSKAIVIQHWMVWSSFSVESIQAIMVTLCFLWCFLKWYLHVLHESLVLLLELYQWLPVESVRPRVNKVVITMHSLWVEIIWWYGWVDSWWTCLGDVWCCLCKQ